jgi:SanA protein
VDKQILIKHILNNQTMNRYIIPSLKLLLLLMVTIVLLLILTRLIMVINARLKTYSLQNAPFAQTAIIFGAGLRKDGSPTPVLKDRVKAGAELYLSGKVKRLLLTGDNRFENYNEPAAMALYAQELGIPSKDLMIDYGGKSTYDSCYRAKKVYELEQAVLVTQSFHLPRALFICDQLGIRSQGVSADLRQYWLSSLLYWNIREIPASFAALIDVWILKPIPNID